MKRFGQKCLHSGNYGSVRAEVVLFGQKWLYLGKVLLIGQKLLYSCKVVVFGQKLLYSDKSGCVRAKWL